MRNIWIISFNKRNSIIEIDESNLGYAILIERRKIMWRFVMLETE